MSDSTLPAVLMTIPWAQVPLALLGRVLPVIRETGRIGREFDSLGI